ncbi:hypothetical protein VTI74DRAFT_5405 [Chaetomium olivicolor]
MGSLQPAATDIAKPEILEYLDAAMANSTFIATDFAPLWTSGAPDEITRAAFFPYPTAGELPCVNGSLGFDPNTPLTADQLQQLARTSAPMSVPNHVAQQQQHGQPGGGMVAQTPLNATEENLPPWLWPTTGSPDIMTMPSLGGAEDMDMNMDEGFDWQGWQESLGRYEVEANGGRSGSTWGPGL